MMKFGIQNGLNVARAGYSEDQILTACMLADRTGYDSIFYMDHTNVPQWKKMQLYLTHGSCYHQLQLLLTMSN